MHDSARLARAALPQNAEMALDLPAHLPPVQADRNQVQQVLMNLVLNAGEALEGRQGAVSITAGRQTVGQGEEAGYVAGAAPGPGAYVYLQVSDTGTGMNAATLARVSSHFSARASPAAAWACPPFWGSCAAIRAGWPCGASPAAARPSPSCGPWRRASPAIRPSPAAGAGGSAPLAAPMPGRPAVLVVDDEPAVLEALADILDLAGIPVVTAANGQEAIDVFAGRQAEIGLVVLDILMPVMNGGLALRELRRLDPSVPVVLASGYDDHEIERRLAEWQISERPDAFMQKPLGADAVQEIARHFLSCARA